MHLRALSFALASVLVACSGGRGESATEPGTGTGTDTDATGSTSPTDATTEGPLDPACSCLETDSCGAEICERVGLVCGEECEDPAVDDEAALQCVLEALRDRKPGLVSWFDSPSVTTTYGTRVYIQGDGDAIVVESGGVDLCSYSGPDARRSLEEPAYFEGCLALATSDERFTCMADGLGERLVECRPLSESCGF